MKRAPAEERRHVRRRNRVHALRHLRLSARPDAGRAAAARHRRRYRLVHTTPWSASATRRARRGRAPARRRSETIWFRLREKLGATEFLGYETESAEGVVAALVKDGKEVSELKKGESGAVVINQTPFYGESPAARSAIPARCAAMACGLTVTDTQKKAGDLFVHYGQGRGGDAQGRRPAAARRRSRAPRRDPPQPFRHASAARGAAPGARRSRRAEGLAGGARPAALRFLASQADDRGRDSRRSRTSPTTSSCRIRR